MEHDLRGDRTHLRLEVGVGGDSIVLWWPRVSLSWVSPSQVLPSNTLLAWIQCGEWPWRKVIPSTYLPGLGFKTP